MIGSPSSEPLSGITRRDHPLIPLSSLTSGTASAAVETPRLVNSFLNPRRTLQNITDAGISHPCQINCGSALRHMVV
jgi:hypothetical protein